MSEVRQGDRVRLVRCADPYTSLRPGDEGTVVRYGERPEPHLDVDWDSGSGLRLLPDEGDSWEILPGNG